MSPTDEPKMSSSNDLFYDSGSSSHNMNERKIRLKKSKTEHLYNEAYIRDVANDNNNDDEVTCAACGFESTFVPEGMILCPHCNKTQYCSTHCLTWDWRNGDHAKVCSGKVGDSTKQEPQEKSSTNRNYSVNLTQYDNSDGTSQNSVDVHALFDRQSPLMIQSAMAKSPSSSLPINNLKSLNKDKNPDPGTTSPTPTLTPQHSTKKDDGSQSFESKVQNQNDDPNRMGKFVQIQENNNSTTTQSDLTRHSDPFSPDGAQSNSNSIAEELICKACGFESEFVEDGMVACPHCKVSFYCSVECRDWDWKRGNHARSCIPVSSDVHAQRPNTLQKQPSFWSRSKQPAPLIQKQKSQKFSLSTSLHSTAYNTVPPKPGDEGYNSSLSSVDFSLVCDIVSRDSMLQLGSMEPKDNSSVKTPISSKAPPSNHSGPFKSPSINSVHSPMIVDEDSEARKIICKACGFDAEFVEEGMLSSSVCGNALFCSQECLDWYLNRGKNLDTNTKTRQTNHVEMNKRIQTRLNNDDNNNIHLFQSDQEDEKSLPMADINEIFDIGENDVANETSEKHEPSSCADQLSTSSAQEGVGEKSSLLSINSRSIVEIKQNSSGQVSLLSSEAWPAQTSHEGPGVKAVSPNSHFCTVCGFELAFLEGNMLTNGGSGHYCSKECLNFDASRISKDQQFTKTQMQQKEHDNTNAERKDNNKLNDEQSPEILDTNETIVTNGIHPGSDRTTDCIEIETSNNIEPQKNSTSNYSINEPSGTDNFRGALDDSPMQVEEESIECKACGFESIFVEEGMTPCQFCIAVTYCSVECRDWDWRNGGHSTLCKGRQMHSSFSTRSNVDDEQSLLSFDHSLPSGLDSTRRSLISLNSSTQSNSASVTTDGEKQMSESSGSDGRSNAEKQKSTRGTVLEVFNGDYDGTQFCVDDDDVSVSMDDLRDEESTQLKSIKEEGDSEFSDEPVSEGSWRSRTPFLAGEDISVSASQCISSPIERDVQASSTFFSQQSQATMPTSNLSRQKKTSDYSTLGSIEIRLAKNPSQELFPTNTRDYQFSYKSLLSIEDNTSGQRSGTTLEYSDSVNEEVALYVEESEKCVPVELSVPHENKQLCNRGSEKENVSVMNESSETDPIIQSAISSIQDPEIQTKLQLGTAEDGENTVQPVTEKLMDTGSFSSLKKNSSSTDIDQRQEENTTIKLHSDSAANTTSSKNKVRSTKKQKSTRGTKKTDNDLSSSSGSSSSSSSQSTTSDSSTTSESSKEVEHDGFHQHITYNQSDFLSESMSSVTFPSFADGSEVKSRWHAGFHPDVYYQTTLEKIEANTPDQSETEPAPPDIVSSPNPDVPFVPPRRSPADSPSGNCCNVSTKVSSLTAEQPSFEALKESFKRALMDIKDTFGEETAERLFYHLTSAMKESQDDVIDETDMQSQSNSSKSVDVEDNKNMIAGAAKQFTANKTNHSGNGLSEQLPKVSRYNEYRGKLEAKNLNDTEKQKPREELPVMEDPKTSLMILKDQTHSASIGVVELNEAATHQFPDTRYCNESILPSNNSKDANHASSTQSQLPRYLKYRKALSTSQHIPNPPSMMIIKTKTDAPQVETKNVKPSVMPTSDTTTNLSLTDLQTDECDTLGTNHFSEASNGNGGKSNTQSRSIQLETNGTNNETIPSNLISYDASSFSAIDDKYRLYRISLQKQLNEPDGMNKHVDNSSDILNQAPTENQSYSSARYVQYRSSLLRNQHQTCKQPPKPLPTGAINSEFVDAKTGSAIKKKSEFKTQKFEISSNRRSDDTLQNQLQPSSEASFLETSVTQDFDLADTATYITVDTELHTPACGANTAISGGNQQNVSNSASSPSSTVPQSTHYKGDAPQESFSDTSISKANATSYNPPSLRYKKSKNSLLIKSTESPQSTNGEISCVHSNPPNVDEKINTGTVYSTPTTGNDLQVRSQIYSTPVSEITCSNITEPALGSTFPDPFLKSPSTKRNVSTEDDNMIGTTEDANNKSLYSMADSKAVEYHDNKARSKKVKNSNDLSSRLPEASTSLIRHTTKIPPIDVNTGNRASSLEKGSDLLENQATPERFTSKAILNPTFDNQDFSSYPIDEEAAKRAQTYKLKLRLKYTFMVILLIVSPIAIGLGVRGNKPKNYYQNVLTESPQKLKPTISPVASPVVNDRKPSLRPTKKVRTRNPSPSESSAFPGTLAPSKQGEEHDVLRTLMSASFDNGVAMRTPETPQNEAFLWLLDDPERQKLSTERLLQRYSLATLFFSTNGKNWTNNIGWLTAENECTWFTGAKSTTAVCDEKDNLNVLNLSLNNLSGTIPPELALLQKLSNIILPSNAIQTMRGAIPSELGLLTDLIIFDVRGNELIGTIPVEISRLVNLETLNLSMNSLSGSIPSEIGRLTALRQLNLSMNRLTGRIPDTIGYLQNLESLLLDDNIFDGSLPSKLGGLHSLRVLDLRKNQLTAVPSEISELQSLETLVLGENNISGSLFTDLGQMTSLAYLDLRSNSFTGSFPSEIGLLTNLQVLDLSSNRLQGPIPSQVGNLSLLTELALQTNRFDGSIPTELGLLSELQSVRVEENSLSGKVSETICSTFAKSLTVFALDCGSGNGSTEIECPPQTCCTICCTDSMGCVCEYEGTGLDFLCKSL